MSSVAKKTITKLLLTTAKVLVCLYLLAVLVVFFFLNQLMFHPHQTRASELLKKQMIILDSTVGPITCLYLKNENAPKTIIYSHGNAEDVADRVWSFATFTNNGLSVLAYDYPGYGLSPGKPTEAGVYAAADAAYTYLTEKCNVKPEEIIVYGRSIGSGPSCYLAEKHPVGGLILECGFTSITRTVTRIRIVPTDAFPNINRIQNIRCPILFLHGEEDSIVPFSHAQKMYAAAHEPKYKLWIPGCDHANIIQFIGTNYDKTISDFLKTISTNKTL